MYATRDYNEPRLDLLPRLYRVYAPKRTHTISPQTFIDGLYAYAPQDVFLKSERRHTNPIQILNIRRVNGAYIATCFVVKAGLVKQSLIAANQPLIVQ